MFGETENKQTTGTLVVSRDPAEEDEESTGSFVEKGNENDTGTLKVEESSDNESDTGSVIEKIPSQDSITSKSSVEESIIVNSKEEVISESPKVASSPKQETSPDQAKGEYATDTIRVPEFRDSPSSSSIFVRHVSSPSLSASEPKKQGPFNAQPRGSEPIPVNRGLAQARKTKLEVGNALSATQKKAIEKSSSFTKLIIKEGELFILGATVPVWAERFFKLDSQLLAFYKNKRVR